MFMLPWGFIGSNPVGWSRQWLPHGNHKWLVGEYRSNNTKRGFCNMHTRFVLSIFIHYFQEFLGISWNFQEFLGIPRNIFIITHYVLLLHIKTLTIKTYYYVIITYVLLHCYYIVITLLLHFHYYLLLHLYYYILLHHYYIIITLIITSLLKVRKSCNNEPIITYYCICPFPLLHHNR